jgi:cytosine permease
MYMYKIDRTQTFEGKKSASKLLAPEYEHEPVPMEKRRSLFSMISIWLAMPMVISGAITGSLIVIGLGFKRGLIAMIVGNLLMFVYTVGTSLLGTQRGVTYAQLASVVFGRKGYTFSSALIATLLLGWYAVQVGMTGDLISAAFGLNFVAMTIVAGVLYWFITFLGVRGLHWIGLISAPLFIGLGIWGIATTVEHAGWDAVWEYQGLDEGMSFGVGLTMVLAFFVDAATAGPDFSRWARNSKDSIIATFTGFPVGNLFGMLTGGIMTAALANPNPNPFQTDNLFGYIISQNILWFSILGVIFLYANLGSVCSHVFYNAVTGWARITRTNMRNVSVVLAIIGIIGAASHVTSYFVQWLGILGVLVPPIGTLVIIDQYLLRPGAPVTNNWRASALFAWGVGSVAGLAVEMFAPQWCTAVTSAVVAGVVYLIIGKTSTSSLSKSEKLA